MALSDAAKANLEQNRRDNGEFGEHLHTAPEFGIADPTTQESIETDAAVAFIHSGVIPPRARKPRDIRDKVTVRATMKTVSIEDAPVGLTVRHKRDRIDDATGEYVEYEAVDEYRVVDGVLMEMMKTSVHRGDAVPVLATEEFVRGVASSDYAYENEYPAYQSVESIQEDLERKTDEKMDGYRIVDGVVWRKAAEPVYQFQTFGLGRNHGGSSLSIGSAHANERDGFQPESTFRADDYEAAVAYAVAHATERGDTNSLDHIRNTPRIEVSAAWSPDPDVKFAPRLTYTEPYRIEKDWTRGPNVPSSREELDDAWGVFRDQLLSVPGAVIEVPSPWGGVTRTINPSALSEKQASDYREYMDMYEALNGGAKQR